MIRGRLRRAFFLVRRHSAPTAADGVRDRVEGGIARGLCPPLRMDAGQRLALAGVQDSGGAGEFEVSALRQVDSPRELEGVKVVGRCDQ